MSAPPSLTDAHAPAEIARKIESSGVAKVRAGTLSILLLAALAGAFISLGGLFYLVVVSGSNLGFGPTRLLGSLAFCVGLVLVIVAGAELFTGNNLLAMAWASRLITTRDILRNWLLVYLGNVIGCLGTVVFVLWADIDLLGNGLVGETAMKVAQSKCAFSVGQAFARGVLCNALVCLAVWLAMGGRSVTDKVFAVLFPIAAFVTMGFEHSIANWFFLPYALALDASGGIELSDALRNLVVVSAGNIVGGTLLVAAVYWIAYLRGARDADARSPD